MSVRTRFAPSPTGYLHIGGVRTALFNWLFARHHGGQFVLRIDDTDRQRNVEQALQPILDGFRWLGLDWDEGPEVGGPYEPYFQSARAAQHRAAVGELLDRGAAYRDFATQDEVQAEREQAQRDKRRFIYSRRWMAATDAVAEQFAAEGRAGVVRLKMPREGRCELDDLVRGPVSFDWALEQDHVIQRADGTCLYHLASAVDDHDLHITHVIRAVEHLSNTPRQAFIAQSLGYELPRYAHLPYVAAPGSTEKLSKRKLATYLRNHEFKKVYDHGVAIAEALEIETTPEGFSPVVVDFYREVGYRPEALVNYLLLLGWSLDDRTETFSRQEMVRYFSLDRVKSSAASFDPQKLLAFQARYNAAWSSDERVAAVTPYLRRAGLIPPSPGQADIARVASVVNAAADRLTVSGDILSYREFFLADDAVPFEPKAFKKRLLGDGAAARVLKFRHRLVSLEPFDAVSIERDLKAFVEDEGLAIGQIVHAIRVAVTGKAVGFGLFDALAILGRESCLARLDRALALVREALAGNATT